MGPLFVLLIWAFVGGILSLIGGLVLAGLVSLLTRGVESGRKRAIFIAGCLPAIGCGYLFVCLVIFSAWSLARGRDMGWGDSWDTPILGSYHLQMIDLTDEATVYNQSDSRVYQDGQVRGSSDDPGVIFRVRRLEVRPPFLFGTASPDAAFTERPIKSPETLFFVLDTRSGTRTNDPTLNALQADAQRFGGPLKLEPVDVVYSRYRYGKADLIPGIAFAIPPLIALFFLTRALIRLRATRQQAATDSIEM